MFNMLYFSKTVQLPGFIDNFSPVGGIL